MNRNIDIVIGCAANDGTAEVIEFERLTAFKIVKHGRTHAIGEATRKTKSSVCRVIRES